MDICLKEKDYTTHNFLQWYVSEQIEEEALARKVMDKLKLIGDDKGGHYLFNRDLAEHRCCCRRRERQALGLAIGGLADCGLNTASLLLI